MPMAVLIINGKILLGFPLGSSPIKPELWAPIGLKYLKEANFKLFLEVLNISFKSDSIVNLHLP